MTTLVLWYYWPCNDTYRLLFEEGLRDVDGCGVIPLLVWTPLLFVLNVFRVEKGETQMRKRIRLSSCRVFITAVTFWLSGWKDKTCGYFSKYWTFYFWAFNKDLSKDWHLDFVTSFTLICKQWYWKFWNFTVRMMSWWQTMTYITSGFINFQKNFFKSDTCTSALQWGSYYLVTLILIIHFGLF